MVKENKYLGDLKQFYVGAIPPLFEGALQRGKLKPGFELVEVDLTGGASSHYDDKRYEVVERGSIVVSRRSGMWGRSSEPRIVDSLTLDDFLKEPLGVLEAAYKNLSKIV